jgi:hypothetical protein
METRDPDGSARRPSRAAVISITLFVVRGSPPPCSSTTPSSQQTTAAHPPGPGLRWHAPSVHTITSPGAVSGRWPGSDLDRRRGRTAICRDSTNPGTRKAARQAVLGRIPGTATPDRVLRARRCLTAELANPIRRRHPAYANPNYCTRLAGPACGDDHCVDFRLCCCSCSGRPASAWVLVVRNPPWFDRFVLLVS